MTTKNRQVILAARPKGASGAVGSVGIAGGKDKCDYVTSELGFDACLDHRDPSLKERFRVSTPGGATSTSRTWAARSSTWCSPA